MRWCRSANPPPRGGGGLLAALRDETEPAVVGPALPEAREEPHGEGPWPAGGERLAEEERGEGEVVELA